MGWFRRSQRAPPPEAAVPEEDPPSRSVERAAPGVTALFSGLKEDGRHTVLDLGPASGASFRLYSAYARRIRFGDLLPDPPRGEAWEEGLRDLRPIPDHPYDLILAWNLLDRLPEQRRPTLIQRLTELTVPGARLYVVLDQVGESYTFPWRFSLLDLERVRQEAVGSPRRTHPIILPAELERLLGSFRVVHAFTLRNGSREYVALRR